MTQQQRVIRLELSADQNSEFGKLLFDAYYRNGVLHTILNLAPSGIENTSRGQTLRRYGYPHNGGKHRLSIYGGESEVLTWLDLLRENTTMDLSVLRTEITHTSAEVIHAISLLPLLFRHQETT